MMFRMKSTIISARFCNFPGTSLREAAAEIINNDTNPTTIHIRMTALLIEMSIPAGIKGTNSCNSNGCKGLSSTDYPLSGR
jgi:hypothetical protein